MALRDLARQAKALPKLRSLTDLTGFARLLSPIAREKVIRVKALGGQTVTLRGGTSDTATFLDVFYYRPHLPAAIKPRLIWDLGANIGLTMAHLAHTFPPAHIVGVELDPANATLARRNTQPWADRCEVICAPVWSERLDGRHPASTRARIWLPSRPRWRRNRHAAPETTCSPRRDRPIT